MPTVARLTLQVDVDGAAESRAQLEAIDRLLKSRADSWSRLTGQFVAGSDAETDALKRTAAEGARSNETLARSFDRPRDALGRFRRESDDVHERVGRDVDRDTDRHRRFGGVLGAVGQQMTRMAARASIVTQAYIPLAVAGFQVGAALTPLVGLAGAIPALLAAGGVAAGTAGLAFHGMGDALTAMAKAQDGSKASVEAMNRALAALPPAARPVVRQLFEMRGMVSQLRQTAAAGIMPGVSAVLTSLRGLFPIVRREIGQTADVMGRLARGAALWAQSPAFRRDFQTLIGGSSRLTAQFGRAAVSLAHAFLDVAVAGQPLAMQFGGLIQQGALWIQRATAGARASGAMARFFQQAGDTAEQLFAILADVVMIVVNLGRAAAPAGSGLLDMLEKLLDRAAHATNNIERLRLWLSRLSDAFLIARTAMLGVAFGPWGAAAGIAAGALLVLYRRSETFRAVVQQIAQVISRNALPIFRSLSGWFTGQLLPAIQRTIPFVREQFAGAFQELSRALGQNRGQFQQVGAIIVRVAGWILVNLVPAAIRLGAIMGAQLVRNVALTIRIFGFVVNAIRAVVGVIAVVIRAIQNFIQFTTRTWAALVANTRATFARVQAVIQTVVTAISRAWNAALAVTRAVWGFIRANVFDNIRRVLVEVGRAIGGLIPRQIRDGWNASWRATSQLWGTIRNFLRDTLNSMGGNVARSIGSAIPASIRNGWNSALRSTRDTWNSIRNTVADGTRRAWNTIVGWGRDIRGLFSRMIGDATGWGRRIWANIRSGIGQIDLRRFIRDALNRGINTINSFARGVASFGNRLLPGSPLQWTNIPTLRQAGGLIPGLPRGDRVPVLAEGGEVMIRQPVAEPLRDALLALNRLPGSAARALARELRGSRRVDIGGDVARMVVSRNPLSRPDRQGVTVPVGRQQGGLIPTPDGWVYAPGFQAGGLVQQRLLVGRVQNWLRAQDPKPYIWGGAGPGGFDCSGIAGAVYGLLTGRGGGQGQRYFTTGSIPAGTALQPGRGTYTIGVTPGAGHMAGNLAGLGFEARSRDSGILVGPAARSVMSFARQFYLPSVGGQFVDTGQGGFSLWPILSRLLSPIMNLARGALNRLGGDSLVGGLARGMGNQFIDGLARRLRDLATFGGGGGAVGGGGLSPAEAWIIQRESGGRTTADNPTSTAFGLGQLLAANRQRYGAILGVSPNTTDYTSQLQMFRMYVRDRYGTAENAQRFWQAHGWYQHGLDTIVRRPTVIGVGEAGPEHVQVTPGNRRAGDTGPVVLWLQRQSQQLSNLGTTLRAIRSILADAARPGRIFSAVIRPAARVAPPTTPTTGLRAAGQELLRHVQGGGGFFEDLTFRGASANLNRFNDELQDLWFRTLPAVWDFTGGTRNRQELLTFLRRYLGPTASFHSGGTLPEDIIGLGRSGRRFNFQGGETLIRQGGAATQIIVQRDGIHVELHGTYAQPITMADVHGAVGSAIRELRVAQVKGERIRWPGSNR